MTPLGSLWSRESKPESAVLALIGVGGDELVLSEVRIGVGADEI